MSHLTFFLNNLEVLSGVLLWKVVSYGSMAHICSILDIRTLTRGLGLIQPLVCWFGRFKWRHLCKCYGFCTCICRCCFSLFLSQLLSFFFHSGGHGRNDFEMVSIVVSKHMKKICKINGNMVWFLRLQKKLIATPLKLALLQFLQHSTQAQFCQSGPYTCFRYYQYLRYSLLIPEVNNTLPKPIIKLKCHLIPLVQRLPQTLSCEQFKMSWKSASSDARCGYFPYLQDRNRLSDLIKEIIWRKSETQIRITTKQVFGICIKSVLVVNMMNIPQSLANCLPKPVNDNVNPQQLWNLRQLKMQG